MQQAVIDAYNCTNTKLPEACIKDDTVYACVDYGKFFHILIQKF